MPGGATTCLNTTIFKSNVFCVLYAIQIFDKALFHPLETHQEYECKAYCSKYATRDGKS